jgi:hypothetical protein
MARIEDSKPKGNILDSGYYRATGSPPLAELLKQAHSLVITPTHLRIKSWMVLI